MQKSFSMTVTITDNTKGPWSLFDLLTKGTPIAPHNGATCVPSGGVGLIGPLCSNVNVQRVSSGSGNVLGGDKDIAADGSRQGASLSVAGQSWYIPSPVLGNGVDLSDHYITADTNSLVVNIQVECQL